MADDPLAEELRQRYLPYVSIGREPGGSAPYVDLDTEQGIEVLLRHFREQGARKTALIVGSARRHAHLGALAAYERFCATTGQMPMIALVDEQEGEQGGYDHTLRLLAEHPELDAVCATVDAFATGCLRALTESGRRVPNDVLLATRYDGLRARLADPPLTSLDLHLDDVAAAAVDLLLVTLQNPDAPATGRSVAPVTLVARESTNRTRR
jgi:DNA-binding LacI/PurR family transcriptional regulator